MKFLLLLVGQRGNGLMRVSAVTSLKLGTLVCAIVAYKLMAHGVTMKDGNAIGLGYLAFVAAVLLFVSAIWIRQKQK